MERLLLKPSEVMTATGLGRSTVYRLIRRGELPAIHIGKAVRVPVKGLNEWIERRGNTGLAA